MRLNLVKTGFAEVSAMGVRCVLSVLNPMWVNRAICASKLKYHGHSMTDKEAHKQRVNRFIELSKGCHKQINADAVGWWKDGARI